jgi:hypothetical protein
LPIDLAKGKSYEWQLSLRCDTESNGIEIVNFKGTVIYQDLNPPVQAALAQANSTQQKADIYVQADRWLDAMPLFMEDAQLPTKPFAEMIAAIGLEAPPKKP